MLERMRSLRTGGGVQTAADESVVTTFGLRPLTKQARNSGRMVSTSRTTTVDSTRAVRTGDCATGVIDGQGGMYAAVGSSRPPMERNLR